MLNLVIENRVPKNTEFDERARQQLEKSKKFFEELDSLEISDCFIIENAPKAADKEG